MGRPDDASVSYRVHDAETGVLLQEGVDAQRDLGPELPDLAEAIREGRRELAVPPLAQARAFILPRDVLGPDFVVPAAVATAAHPYRSAATPSDGGPVPRAVRIAGQDDALLVPVAVEGAHLVLEDARGRALRVVLGTRPEEEEE